jgi:electron transfer flavoprotein alpha subunit
MASNVLVFVERREGQVKRPSLEAIGVACGMAEILGGSVDTLAVGPGAGECAAEVGRFGARRLYHVDDDALEHYAPEAYAACLAQAAKTSEAAIVLAPATVMGKDLAARAAARLETACASDLVEVEVDAQGKLSGKRPVYSGKAYARVSIPVARPAMATLRPNVFPAKEIEGGSPAEAIGLESPVPAEAIRLRTIEIKRGGDEDVDVSEASVVVAGGRGLKEAENFGMLRDLAKSLGGAVGASRAVVDAGWIDHATQVGQTGKVVSPNLYIACGISGAIQHLAGMSSSKVIVAINKDPDAPIFKIADYGIVGDALEIIPALTKAVEDLKR